MNANMEFSASDGIAMVLRNMKMAFLRNTALARSDLR